MGLISNGTTIFDAGALDSGIPTGAMTFIKKLTASGSGTLSFVHGSGGVDFSTYKEYVFTYNNIHPATNGAQLTINFRDGGTAYDATKTTTVFDAYQKEDGSAAALGYNGSKDLAQGTGAQILTVDTINNNDASASGIVTLFNPSSTTFVKHFIGDSQGMGDGSPPYSHRRIAAGYANVTAAIDGVQFAMSSGNIDVGDICLYGIS